MPENIMPFTYGYLTAISLVAVIATLVDKRAAKRNSQRIAERTLIILSALGGSVAMYVIMKIIRHKTKHTKFMVGLPVIIVLQIAAAVFIWWRWNGGNL